VISAALVALLFRVAITQKPKLTGRILNIPVAQIEAGAAPLRAQKLPRGLVLELNNAVDEAWVVIVTVVLALCAPLSVSWEGEIAHCAPGGSPPHDNVTLWLKPPRGISTKENVAVPPGATVRLPGDPNNAKPWPVPGEITVTVVEPQMAPAQALTVAVPGATPKTTPLLVESLVIPLLLPESFVTVATVLSEEFQITEARVCVLLSLNVPIATSA